MLEVEKLAKEERNRKSSHTVQAALNSIKVNGKEKERELEQVHRDLNQARERLQFEGEEKKKQEEEAKALQAELTKIAGKVKEEAEDVEMVGIGPLSQKIMVDAAMNTERRTYAQAAVQAQAEEKPEV